MVPKTVAEVERMGGEAGFGLSCDPGVGALLAVLAAAVPPGGAILELGIGSGVGLAWIVEGLGGRTDVRLISVEIDPEVAAVAASHPWPGYVHLEVADALDVLRAGERWNLLFADAQGGKWDGLDDSIAALAPGGLLLVDDMTPESFVDDRHREKTAEVREHLLADDRLVAVEVAWSTGIILCARKS